VFVALSVFPVPVVLSRVLLYVLVASLLLSFFCCYRLSLPCSPSHQKKRRKADTPPSAILACRSCAALRFGLISFFFFGLLLLFRFFISFFVPVSSLFTLDRFSVPFFPFIVPFSSLIVFDSLFSFLVSSLPSFFLFRVFLQLCSHQIRIEDTLSITSFSRLFYSYSCFLPPHLFFLIKSLPPFVTSLSIYSYGFSPLIISPS